MKVYISVVSHGHSDLINQLSCLTELAKEFYVIVKSNKPGDSFPDLVKCGRFRWVNDFYHSGFGHNNNIVFSYCQTELGMQDDDFFIVLNPDVVITTVMLKCLINEMKHDLINIAAINLYKDIENKIYDNSIRHFPSLKQFIISFLGFGNSSVLDKSRINSPCRVDWAAGSFMAFKCNYYAKLGGFDENYFMYCEDIDICYRSYRIGQPVTFYPNIIALHLARHSSRRLFSKHFYWHVSSVIRYLLSKVGLTKQKSILRDINQ